MMTNIYKIIKRDSLLYFRTPMQCLTPLLFFIFVSVLFPVVISADEAFLKMVGAGVIWIGIVLANLLSLPYLFDDDFHFPN